MRSEGARRRIRLGTAAAVAVVLPASLTAQSPPLQVNPNRPTFATPALTTQVGVAELELGLQHSVARDEGGISWSPFLLKLGLLPRLELRLGGNGLLRQSQAGGSATGFGDTTVGAQWTYFRDGPLGLDQAVQLTWKLPTASAAKGLGSGEPDATLMILFSRDLGPFHADLNFLETGLGRPATGGGGAERQPAAALSVSRTLSDQWSLTGEIYAIGATSQNPTIFSNLWAMAYKVSPRLVLDGGLDVGLSHGAQKVALFAGLTVGVARFRQPPPR